MVHEVEVQWLRELDGRCEHETECPNNLICGIEFPANINVALFANNVSKLRTKLMSLNELSSDSPPVKLRDPSSQGLWHAVRISSSGVEPSNEVDQDLLGKDLGVTADSDLELSGVEQDKYELPAGRCMLEHFPQRAIDERRFADTAITSDQNGPLWASNDLISKELKFVIATNIVADLLSTWAGRLEGSVPIELQKNSRRRLKVV